MPKEPPFGVQNSRDMPLLWPEPTHWPQDARSERIIGDWNLYQRKGGHRTSTDDVLTAYFAAWRFQKAHAAAPERYLDLGCGVASVMLMTAHRLRPAQSVGWEAQPQSVQMARRSLQELGPCGAKMRIVEGDFRHPKPELGRFALVTASPPYFPLGTGSLPEDPQRRACRFEARGGIEAYCDAIARHLSPDPGACAYAVFQSAGQDRVRAAVECAGLAVTARLDVHMRSDRRQPFLTVFEIDNALPRREVERFGFAIRDAQGQITPEYAAARRFLGVDR